MTELLILLVVVGLAVGIARLFGKNVILEKEKATWEKSQAASDARVKLLQDQLIKNEYEKRANEAKVAEDSDDDLERTDVYFYPPGVRRDDPPN